MYDCNVSIASTATIQDSTQHPCTMAPSHSSNPWEGHTRIVDNQSDAGSPEDEDEDAESIYPGDYSTQLEELFNGEEDYETEQRSDNDDEDFVYDGIDADASISYRDQLRNVLGQEDADEREDEQVDQSHNNGNGVASHENDKPLVGVRLSMIPTSLLIAINSTPQTWHSSKDPQLSRRGYLHQIKNSSL